MRSYSSRLRFLFCRAHLTSLVRVFPFSARSQERQDPRRSRCWQVVPQSTCLNDHLFPLLIAELTVPNDFCLGRIDRSRGRRTKFPLSCLPREPSLAILSLLVRGRGLGLSVPSFLPLPSHRKKTDRKALDAGFRAESIGEEADERASSPGSCLSLPFRAPFVSLTLW